MRIGFVCLPLSGHMNPMTALALKLQSRGNEVVFVGVADTEPYIRAAGLEFISFCEKEYPKGSIAKEWATVANRHGLDAVEYTVREVVTPFCKATLEDITQKIKSADFDLLVI